MMAPVLQNSMYYSMDKWVYFQENGKECAYFKKMTTWIMTGTV